MKKKKQRTASKNVAWPASEPKYEGFNNTKRPVHRNGRKRPAPAPRTP